VLFTRQPSTGWVVYHEVMQTTKNFIRDLTVVEKDWFTELAWVPPPPQLASPENKNVADGSHPVRAGPTFTTSKRHEGYDDD
jgi:hypothetical protein